MDKLSFDAATHELAKLYSEAEPRYASFLSRDLFDLLRKTHELAYRFQGFPAEKAQELALVKAYQTTGKSV